MMHRALLVLLVVINVGIAAWWALRAPAPPPPPIEQPAGVPRLQLLSEVPARARPVAAAASVSSPPGAVWPGAAATGAVVAVPGDAHCMSFGPFENPALLRRANDVLQPRVLRASVRNEVSSARGWRVFVPPLATREAAQALADRMTAAGLEDLLVMPAGVDQNAVALGRFGNEAAARRRQKQVDAAGFSGARVEPIGQTRTQGWIDVAAAPAFDAAAAARDSAAPRTAPLDCATLR